MPKQDPIGISGVLRGIVEKMTIETSGNAFRMAGINDLSKLSWQELAEMRFQEERHRSFRFPYILNLTLRCDGIPPRALLPHVYVQFAEQAFPDSWNIIESDDFIGEYEMNTIAIMQSAEKDWCKVYLPYDKACIDAIKDQISSTFRRPIYSTYINKKTGKPRFEHWMIHKTQVNVIVDLVSKHWPGADIQSDLVEAVGSAETDWIGSVFDSCPKQQLDKLYRGLATVFHPDVGGDTAIMARINVEYTERMKNGSKSQ